MSEIWTAKEEKDGLIIFDVTDEETHQVRQEQRDKSAIPLMFALGGYPPQMGVLMQLQTLPWRFRKVGDNIYLDDTSISVDDYHPIDAPA
jgi:hypothetical protein